MFTNGMLESKASAVSLCDISVDAFLALLRFMYGGKLEMEDETRIGALLVPLLFLADQFGIKRLHQECCNYFLEQLSEVNDCQTFPPADCAYHHTQLCDIMPFFLHVSFQMLVHEARNTRTVR